MCHSALGGKLIATSVQRIPTGQKGAGQSSTSYSTCKHAVHAVPAVHAEHVVNAVHTLHAIHTLRAVHAIHTVNEYSIEYTVHTVCTIFLQYH